MKNVLYILVLIFSFSCRNNVEIKDKVFTFYLPSIDMYITTEKQTNGYFSVMFSDTTMSPKTDYLRVKTNSNPINIIFDPKSKKDIYILDSYHDRIEGTNSVKYNLILLNSSEFDSRFYEKQIKTQPRVLRNNGYIHLYIDTMTYSIFLNSSEELKKGDIHGGW